MEDEAYRTLALREQSHWFCVVRREVIAAALNRADVARTGRVLEIGSGTGGNVDMLRTFGELTCIEPSEVGRMFTTSRFAGDLDLRPGSWPSEDGLAPDERFDLIAMLDVLEHVEDAEGALRAVRNRLTEDGRAVVTVPNYRWMWSAHDEQLHHRDRYTPRRLADLAARAGLVPISVSCFNTVLFPLAVGARMASKALGSSSSPGRDTPSTRVNTLAAAAFRCELPWVRRGIRIPYGLSTIAILEAN